MDYEIKTIMYNKNKKILNTKKAIELMFMEYDLYCECFGERINYISEIIAIWKR
jgi:hypothetical protein